MRNFVRSKPLETMQGILRSYTSWRPSNDSLCAYSGSIKSSVSFDYLNYNVRSPSRIVSGYVVS